MYLFRNLLLKCSGVGLGCINPHCSMQNTHLPQVFCQTHLFSLRKMQINMSYLGCRECTAEVRHLMIYFSALLLRKATHPSILPSHDIPRLHSNGMFSF